jgi:hypothetical protein
MLRFHLDVLTTLISISDLIMWLCLRSNILNVLEFLSRPNSQHLVSGTKDRVNLYEKFRSRYEALYPGSIEAVKRKTEEREASLRAQKASIWDNAADVMTGGFKFGF